MVWIKTGKLNTLKKLTTSLSLQKMFQSIIDHLQLQVFLVLLLLKFLAIGHLSLYFSLLHCLQAHYLHLVLL